jgi:hypothetical protein
MRAGSRGDSKREREILERRKPFAGKSFGPSAAADAKKALDKCTCVPYT